MVVFTDQYFHLRLGRVLEMVRERFDWQIQSEDMAGGCSNRRFRGGFLSLGWVWGRVFGVDFFGVGLTCWVCDFK